MPAAGPLPTPTANIGAHAQGALYVAQMLELAKKAIAGLDMSSPIGQAVAAFLKSAGKHAGHAPAETQQNSLQNQLVEAKRNAMQRLALQQMQARGGAASGAPAAGAPPGAGAPPSPAMAA
jgi:hypothetical protein